MMVKNLSFERPSERSESLAFVEGSLSQQTAEDGSIKGPLLGRWDDVWIEFFLTCEICRDGQVGDGFTLNLHGELLEVAFLLHSVSQQLSDASTLNLNGLKRSRDALALLHAD